MNQEVKDFQRATADRILHIYKNLGHRRVLLADEVGLGKTFVAKQVINLVREWHKQEKDDFFKVVYICSNANIADQNIEKLGVENRMSISESRLSMQHLYIKLAEKRIAEQHEQGEMPESIIPLTPSTSFRFYSAQGTANERALMYNILCGLAQFKDYKEVIGDFLSCNVKNWQELTNIYNEKIKGCGDDYLCEMHSKLQTRLSDTIINQLIEYAQNGCDNRQRADIINKLRRIFAEISIDMLDPDLVIMDEFQRFNSLLEQGDDEQSMLANKFFDNERSNTKILLLSATPYKPYSTLEELNTNGNDEHYQDFMKVMDFLYATKDKMDRFKLIWHTYSAALKRTNVVDLTPLVVTKNEAEEALYGVMCRTERFNSGIIDDSRVCDVQVVPEDILSFAEGQYLMDCLNQENTKVRLGNLPMEYVKSSPYLLSFMDKYELKKRIASALQHSDVKRYGKMDALLLSKYAINNYRPIPAANGKLKYLHDLVFGTRHEKKTQLLLWVPASNPYYKAGGVFESNEACNFSKIILFSSWEMVPRMISIMMSYYSELYTLGELKKVEAEIRYTSQKKNRYGENRLRADGLLEYPCRTLSGLFSPTTFYGEKLSSIRKIIKQRIQEEFAQNTIISSIPQQGRNNAKLILTLMKILDGKPVEDLNDLYVPSNALDVMTDIAIASPAVCAYRQSGNEEDAQMVAKAIVSVFNKPESAAVIDLMYNKKNDDDYYESVLDYCVVGNLQAVHDLIKEYATDHQRIVFNGNGYSDEWVAEAERRGLPNIKSMVYAIPALTTDTAIKLFGDFKVFTEAELVSRAEVKFENYAKTINIEAKTMIDMASKQIIPAVIKYATSLAGSINTITAAGVTAVGVQKNLLNETSALLEETQKALDELIAIENAGCEMEDGEAKAKYYYEKVAPAMEALRAPVDKLEMIVDKEMWPMPSYGDLMFEV